MVVRAIKLFPRQNEPAWHETKKEDKSAHIVERSYGSFERSFMLPDDADETKINADFHNGVLKVCVKKSEKAASATRKIEVKSA